MHILKLGTFRSLKKGRYRCRLCGQLLRASGLAGHRSRHYAQYLEARPKPKPPKPVDPYRATRQLERVIPHAFFTLE